MTETDPVATAARAAAGRLAGDYGPGLKADVEAALHVGGSQRRDQYIDPVSVAGLIVSIADLAWGVYIRLRDKAAKPAPEVVARTVRVEMRSRGEGDPAVQDKITDVVVTEIIKAADEPD
jgi:hypothetical protein